MRFFRWTPPSRPLIGAVIALLSLRSLREVHGQWPCSNSLCFHKWCCARKCALSAPVLIRRNSLRASALTEPVSFRSTCPSMDVFILPQETLMADACKNANDLRQLNAHLPNDTTKQNTSEKHTFYTEICSRTARPPDLGPIEFRWCSVFLSSCFLKCIGEIF